MDRRIRQIAGLLTLLLIAVSLSAGWIQGLAAERIATHEPVNPTNPDERARNRFRIFQECRWERGPILSIDGQTLADVQDAPPGRRCLYERIYPMGPLAAHVVGQWSLHYGKSGLEAAYNAALVGDPQPPESLTDLFNQRPRVGNILVSTIDTRLQEVAMEALGDRRGGVVALNPKTGAVLVAASNPTYDPNALASNDRLIADIARCEMGIGFERGEDGTFVRAEDGELVPCRNPHTPMVSVALQTRRPPGSTFKVVTAAAALESGEYTPTAPSVPASSAYTAPGDTRAIHNFGGGTCGGNLTRALAVSCNTAFARIAVDIGADALLATAQAMGLSQRAGEDFVGCESGPLTDIRETHTGCVPEKHERPASEDENGNLTCPAGGSLDRDREMCVQEAESAGFRARAGFGQWVIETSPFGMAAVAATVANDGIAPRPRFGERVMDRRTQETIEEIRTGLGASAMSPESAGQLKDMMRGVVTAGTASRAFSGFPIPSGGKTGTGQQGPFCSVQEAEIFGFLQPGEELTDDARRTRLNRCGRLPHAWYIGFAPIDDPQVAIAVLVERGGGTSESATGGGIAAPIARTVLDSFFRLYPAAAGPSGGID